VYLSKMITWYSKIKCDSNKDTLVREEYVKDMITYDDSTTETETDIDLDQHQSDSDSEDNFVDEANEANDDDYGDDDYISGSEPTPKKQRTCNRAAPNKWSEKEDEILRQAVRKYPGNFKKIATLLHRRRPEECSQHWNRVLKPSIKKEKFNEEEEFKLIEAVKLNGKHWNKVAASLNRTGTINQAKLKTKMYNAFINSRV